MSNDLLSEVRDGVLHLTINRPERRNAVNADVIRGLTEGIQSANSEKTVRAIVITGTGEAAFCAGADLQQGTSFQFDFSEPRLAFANLLRAGRASQIPLIARVNGACMAGGMGVMAMCDLAVATPTARFGLPEVKVGVFPAQVLAVLQPLLPPRVLNAMCLTGVPIDAQQALALGLINQIDADIDAALAQLLEPLKAASGVAIRRGLYTLKHAQGMEFEQAMAFTEGQIGLLAQTEDAREGQAAFREKRKPIWPGR